MSPDLPTSAVPEPVRCFPEPISAEESDWVSEAAPRLAPAACLAELRIVACLLEGEEVGNVPLAFDTAIEPETVREAPSEALPVDAAFVPMAVVPALPEPLDDVVPMSSCIADVEPAGVCPEASAAGTDPASAVTGAMPLFPRSASQQRRRGGKSRKRATPGSESEDASLQLALPLAQPGTPRVAAGQFADRLSRARARLLEEASAPAIAPRAEVLSFADRLKKVRERLADEDAAPGRVSA